MGYDKVDEVFVSRFRRGIVYTALVGVALCWLDKRLGRQAYFMDHSIVVYIPFNSGGVGCRYAMDITRSYELNAVIIFLVSSME